MMEIVSDLPGDRISLSVPAASAYRAVVSLVVGGVGGRIDLPYERTDDLQLAVLSALEAATEDAVTIELLVADEVLRVSVGPLADGSTGDRALRAVLQPLVDGVEGSLREGREWLTLSLSRPSP
jgi:hypothetical protein